MAKILIADDDRATRLLAATLLRHAGHEPLEAADGDTALRIAEEQHPDLVIVDLSMPGLSGAELIRRLRRSAKQLAIALYTATPPNAAMRDFMDMYGIRCLIPKPSEPASFLRCVEKARA